MIPDFKHDINLHPLRLAYFNSQNKLWKVKIHYFIYIIFGILAFCIGLYGLIHGSNKPEVVQSGSNYQVRIVSIGVLFIGLALIIGPYSMYLAFKNYRLTTAPLVMPKTNKIILKTKSIESNTNIIFFIFICLFSITLLFSGMAIDLKFGLALIILFFGSSLFAIFGVYQSQYRTLEINSDELKLTVEYKFNRSRSKTTSFPFKDHNNIENSPPFMSISSKSKSEKISILNLATDPCWLVYVIEKLNKMSSDDEREQYLKSIATDKIVRMPNALG